MYISFRIIDHEAKHATRYKRQTPSHMARVRMKRMVIMVASVYIGRMNRFLSPPVFSATNDFSIYNISIPKFIIMMMRCEKHSIFSHAPAQHSPESHRHQAKYCLTKQNANINFSFRCLFVYTRNPFLFKSAIHDATRWVCWTVNNNNKRKNEVENMFHSISITHTQRRVDALVG